VLCVVGATIVQSTRIAVWAEPADTNDPQQAIAEHLAIGKQLLEQGNPSAAQDAFRTILEIDATHSEALRLMTKAQREIEATRARAERTQQRLKEQAQRLAMELAREKARLRAQQEREAQQQVARAREQQLKYLYNRGLRLYEDGAYQEAIDTLQQMVLLDPAHPLVHAAQRLISRAETKVSASRARARAQVSPQPAAVPALEQQLTAKRIEIDTLLKYAKLAQKDRNYDLVMDLTQQILASDPQHRAAQALLEHAQLAKLDAEQQRLEHLVERDERQMVNEVVKAQILPETQTVRLSPPAAALRQAAMSARLQQPISLEFDDVPLSDVLEFIADAANVSIIPSPQLNLKERRASLKIAQLPLEMAIKYLAKNQGLAYRVEEDAILLATAEEFENEPLQTRVFYLRSGIGPFALETAALASNPLLAMESLKSLIEQSVPQPPDAKLVFDERSGALIATNTTENLALIERLLSQLDVTPLQVLIEARFIELSMTDLEHLGLETVLTNDATLSKKTVPPSGSPGPGNILASGSGFKFPALSRESEGLNLTLQGVLTGTQFETVLHLLDETKKSKTLSAPRVTTLNNQPALIRVVDEFRYPTRYEVTLVQFDINGDGDFDDAGETEFVNVPQDFQKRDVGILLNVTPSVGKDLKTITLVLAPEVSSFSQFRDLGGGVTVPEFTTSQLTTSVVIEEGQTVVLGGLMKDSVSETVTKVPFFGDLPVFGPLFRQKSESATKKNLLIFITARLLAPRGPTT
jgi:type II secretory pathway component GspD/PulD (secretin)